MKAPFIAYPPFSNFVQPHPLPFSFCCLVSLTEMLIIPHLTCFFTSWHYRSTHVEPWYLSFTRTLRCVWCKNTSVFWGLLHAMVFCSTLIWYQIYKHIHKWRHTAHTGANWRTHLFYVDTICYVLTAAVCITLNE